MPPGMSLLSVTQQAQHIYCCCVYKAQIVLSDSHRNSLRLWSAMQACTALIDVITQATYESLHEVQHMWQLPGDKEHVG